MISTLSLMKKKHSLGKSMLAPMLKRSKARALVSSRLVASPMTLKTRYTKNKPMNAMSNAFQVFAK